MRVGILKLSDRTGTFPTRMFYGLEFSDWAFAAPPNYDEKHKNWEYLIKTQDLEGEELQLKVAAKIDDKTLIIISKF